MSAESTPSQEGGPDISFLFLSSPRQHALEVNDCSEFAQQHKVFGAAAIYGDWDLDRAFANPKEADRLRSVAEKFHQYEVEHGRADADDDAILEGHQRPLHGGRDWIGVGEQLGAWTISNCFGGLPYRLRLDTPGLKAGLYEVHNDLIIAKEYREDEEVSVPLLERTICRIGGGGQFELSAIKAATQENVKTVQRRLNRIGKAHRRRLDRPRTGFLVRRGNMQSRKESKIK